MKWGRVVVLATFATTSANGQSKQTYTQTTGPACRGQSREHVGSWSCPGPGGYRAVFSDEGNVVSILIERPGPGQVRSSPAVWRGGGRVFGDLIEWRVAATGEPFAAIIRTWETTESGEAQESLRVFAISETTSCEYGKVPGRRMNANLHAKALAERAAGQSCRLL